MRYTVRDREGASEIWDAQGQLAATIKDESLLWMLAESMHRERHEIIREQDGAYLAGGPKQEGTEDNEE